MVLQAFSIFSCKIQVLMLSRESKTYNQANAITDVLGLRIICSFLSHLQSIEDLIRKKFQVIEIERKGIHHSFKEFGYQSVHLLIKVPSEILSQFQVEERLVCEIQLRTILQEAWAEIEHALVYKADWSIFDEPLKRKLAALNANLTLSDILFQEIWDYHRPLQLALEKRRESFCTQTHTAINKMIHDGAEGRIFWKMKQEPAMKTQDVGSPAQDKIGDSIDDLLMKALDAHNASQFNKAIDIYNVILGSKAKLPKYVVSIIYLHRGMAHFATSNYEQALKDFSQASELNPENCRSFYYRGMTQQMLQNYHEALNDFNRCLELNPYQFEAFYSRAQVYFQLGNYVKSLRDCEQALNIEPKSRQAKKLRELVMSSMPL